MHGSRHNDAEGATYAIDYVRFRKFQMEFQDDSKSFYTGNLGSVNANKVIHSDTVYLAMPPSLSTQYQANYRMVDLGVGGIGLANMMQNTDGEINFDTLATTIQTAARAAVPEFGASALTQAANSISGFLGLQGSIDVNSLEQMTRGRIFNPYTEQIFNNMSFRNHNFSFKLLSRNPNEANDIAQIIKWFKTGAHPSYEAGDLGRKPRKKGTELGEKGSKYEPYDETLSKLKDLFGWDRKDDDPFNKSQIMTNAEARRYFTIPSKFEIRFMRMDPSGNLMPQNNNPELHFKIHPSVCSAINVNYTPDNQYNALKRAAPDVDTMQVPAVVLNVQFTETKLLTAADVEDGY